MYDHQTIEYDKLLPAKITLRDTAVDRCRGEPHWHEEMQLIYIGEAAKKNGFCHYNHFTKACHKYYGAGPTEIKRQKRQRDAAPNAPLEKSA